ncbi:MAG: hypothetical protein LBU77_01915 [Clostridiales bacterium]|jgi:hypothetical protein|nr:hypothetical protein [Clostridiales bacterium]
MIDVKAEVKKALGAIEGAKVFFYFPQDFKKLPCISYYEAHNAPGASGDDAEYLSEIIYVVDVWGDSSAIVTNIAIETDEKMKGIGFVREFAHDVNDPDSKVRHKTMRFRLLY